MSSTCNIRGIPVSFPFEPYELQKQYMDKVIQCLQNGENGVLESPTGTGKTLSLLCSSLAWLAVKKTQAQEQLISKLNCCAEAEVGKHADFLREINSKINSMHDEDIDHSSAVPKIIYSSRTHTQLSQAMQELKRTAYCNVRSTVLAGRDQLCIHPEVMQEKSNFVKGTLCGAKVKTKSCQFYNRDEKMQSKVSNIMDIEDLVLCGNKERFCPYYMARELHKKADIIFMPYNYLLDGKVRKSFGISLTNCVIIFDEAHNIERICEDSASAQLKKTDIILSIDEVKCIIELLTNARDTNFLNNDQLEKLDEFKLPSLENLKQVLMKLVQTIDAIKINDFANGTTFPGDQIYEIMKESNLTYETKHVVRQAADEVVLFLSILTSGPITYRGHGLSKFLDLLDLVFVGPDYQSNDPNQQQKFIEKVRKCYRVHVNETFKNGNPIKRNSWMSNFKTDNCDRILSFWCFSPGFGMNILMEQEPMCIILTSGTLAPLKPLITELELKIDVRLENSHIIKSNQVCVKVISKGPDLQLLNSNYNNRQNPNYIASLGRTIQNICRILPEGLLVFFPSYTVMNLCQNAWIENGLWASISNIKSIYIEPRDKYEFRQNMKEYYERINDPKHAGAIFMGVCRGKVSEGLDFADGNGRGVIITGLPYPPYMDSRVVLKREYLDQCKKTDKEFLSGSEWYQLEASRAVNQAIGRVIRHRNDYGIILLADSRFASAYIRSNMSKWLQNRIEIVPNFGNLIATTKGFFQEASKNYPVIKEQIVEPTPEIVQKDSVNSLPIPLSDSSTNDEDDEEVEDANGCETLKYLQESQLKKRRKLFLVSGATTDESFTQNHTKDFILLLKSFLNNTDFAIMAKAMSDYRSHGKLEPLITCIQETFREKLNLRYIVPDIIPYLHDNDLERFNTFWEGFKIVM